MRAAALLTLAGLTLAQGFDVVCPTATRTIQNRGCGKTCPFSDCTFRTTIQNPCNCPSAFPTATLIAPCEAECPYQGCDIEFRTATMPCPTKTTTTSTRRPTTTTRRSTTSTTRQTTSASSTPTRVITSIVTLPPKFSSTTKSSSTPCPKVTRTTRPADCPTMRCPVPTCRVTTTMNVPCGCEPRTVLYVTGCATACPTGCLTRTSTFSAVC